MLQVDSLSVVVRVGLCVGTLSVDPCEFTDVGIQGQGGEIIWCVTTQSQLKFSCLISVPNGRMTCRVASVTNKLLLSSRTHAHRRFCFGVLALSFSFFFLFFYVSSLNFHCWKRFSWQKAENCEESVSLRWAHKNIYKNTCPHNSALILTSTPHSLSQSPHLRITQTEGPLCDWIISWKWLKLAGWIDTEAHTLKESQNRYISVPSRLILVQESPIRLFFSLPSFSPIVCTSHLPTNGPRERQWLSNYVCVFS